MRKAQGCGNTESSEKHGKISSVQSVPRVSENPDFLPRCRKNRIGFMSSNYANVTNECGKLRGTENTESLKKHGKISSVQSVPCLSESHHFLPRCRKSRIGLCHRITRMQRINVKKTPSVHSSTVKLLLLLRHCGWIYSFHDGNWGNANNFLSSNYANATNKCKKKRCETYFTSSVWRF
jgi:hypothetical protein